MRRCGLGGGTAAVALLAFIIAAPAHARGFGGSRNDSGPYTRPWLPDLNHTRPSLNLTRPNLNVSRPDGNETRPFNRTLPPFLAGLLNGQSHGLLV
jgi:hypothetical protein